MPERPRLLFVKSRRASFIELDQQLLAERYEVTEIYQPGRIPNLMAVLRAVRESDVVVGWWASWHTFLPFTLAWLLGRPSLLIVGGFDTAAEREYGYGYQLGGIRKYLSRWIMRRARRLMTNSEYSRQEIQRNIGIPSDSVELIYHGIPDTVNPLERYAKRRLALTVGIVDHTNLTRKGLRSFVEAAALLPDVDFVLAGKPVPEARKALRAIAGANVRLAGWIPDEELARLYDEAAVYVQASRHEGFGVSVAEAMLHGCIPVVSAAGALPEVVGESGVVVTDTDPQALAAAVEAGLARARHPLATVAVRDRILTEFSVQRRREGLHRLVDGLLH